MKEILFEVLKHNIKGQECVLVEELVNCLGLQWWNANGLQNESASYFSIAFPGST